MEKIICSTCKIEKPISSFYVRKEVPFGYRKQCSKCLLEKMYDKRVCGIYKITSPSGRVYIGQSVDIRTRWWSYKKVRKSQRKLYNSFCKYGIENHIFEIIEECDEEYLTKKELYWQKHYNVVEDGLNCNYVSEYYSVNNKRCGIKNTKPKIKKIIKDSIDEIIDLNTGVFYYGYLDASNILKIGRQLLTDMLKGNNYNITSLILAKDYEKGLLPSEVYLNNTNFNNKFKCKDELVIIDFSTKNEIGSTKEIANKLNIKESTLRAQLSGVVNNTTNYIYKKRL
jgi:group I intron endonuclease